MAKNTAVKEKTTTNRPTVISFRITDSQEDELAKIRNKEKPMGVDSTRQLCRKLVVDFLAGRLTYNDPLDMKADLELHPRPKR
jgi:DNA-binding PadR family transcriptional regulator